MPVPLPPRYLQARRELGNREIDLDWRKLARRKPRQWPGLIVLDRAADARKENARLAPLMAEGLRGKMFFIGRNLAGLLFAVDDAGRVVVVDEIELDHPVVLARDFDAFARAFVLGTRGRSALRTKERAHELRGIPARWKKLDDLVANDRLHPIVRRMTLHSLLSDIANAYLLDGRRDAFLEELSAFRRRHPTRGKRLAVELRAYAMRWAEPPLAPKRT